MVAPMPPAYSISQSMAAMVACWFTTPPTSPPSWLWTGLNFANGVATAADSSFVLINETGSYRSTQILAHR